jgi:hypothetical protein
MGELQKGLELVKKACGLDHLNFHDEALPLYKESIVHLNNAYNGTGCVPCYSNSSLDPNTDTNTKNVLR